MGFASPARDYEVNDIDLPTYLVPHPLATYFVRVTDNGMDRFHPPSADTSNCGGHVPIPPSSGLKRNALLVIDRTCKPPAPAGQAPPTAGQAHITK